MDENRIDSASWWDVLTPQGVILLALMPMLDEVKMAWVYTSVPLYWLDNDWTLWSLGLVLGLAYVPRMAMTVCVRRFGDWLVIPAQMFGAVASVPVLIFPKSKAALVLGLYGCSSSVNTQAFRSLVSVLFGHQGPLQRKAMRIFTLSDVLGYSLGPAIGGVLYDDVGYVGCVWFQMTVLVLQSVLCAFMPVFRASLSSNCVRWRSESASSGPENDKSTTRIEGGVALPSAPANIVEEFTRESIVWLPLLCVHSVYFTNLFVYVVEWNLYALYFRQVHDWSGTWMGVAQMSGDLFAGILLVFLTTQFCKGRSADFALRHNILANFFGPPYCNVLLLVLHGALLVLLAQPDFALSLCGQVGMGTTFILNEQVLQELLVRYSAGNHALYRKNLFVQYLLFCVSFLLAGLISAPAYNVFGSTVPFYSCAFLAWLNASAFGCFYLHRMATTESGLCGGLDNAEMEILSRHKQSRLNRSPVQSVGPLASKRTQGGSQAISAAIAVRHDGANTIESI